jgi:predicted phosphodiesterase
MLQRQQGNLRVRSSGMRVAVLSDIHGNLTAFKAVLADLKQTSPDLVLHGGDLADGGSSPSEIVDHIRQFAWQGVLGNTDEMLIRPESLEECASQSSAPAALWAAIREVAAATRSALGDERLAWLQLQPRVIQRDLFALVHASPDSCWRVPSAQATEGEMETIYGFLGRPIVVYGHTHRPSIRNLAGNPGVLANSGSVGLPYDGDPRASYLIVESSGLSIRRVEYEVEKELRALSQCGLPGADWTARMLRAGSPVMP